MQEYDLKPTANFLPLGVDEQRNFRVAIGDDGSGLCRAMRQWLKNANYDCCGLGITEGELAPSSHLGIDLLAINYNSKFNDFDEAIERIRSEPGSEAMLLMLVDLPECAEDIVNAVSSGVDDFVVAPVRSAEFLARVKVNLLRASIPNSAVKFLEYGRYRVDPVARQVLLDGEEIKLTPKETDLAMFLFHRIGRLSSHDHILASVWGISPSINTRTVSTYISRIRKRLRFDEDNGLKLTAVYHRGYRLDMIN